jgi:predicted O-linked N-acetylglucosamine transferase (SPINDLY family)
MTDDPAQRLMQAMALHHAGRFTEAESIYREVLQADPKRDEVMHLLGVLLHQRGRSNEGIELIHRAIGRNPSVAGYHLNLGIALAQMSRVEEAMESTRRALSLAPGDAQAHFNLAAMLEMLERFEEAVASYRQAIAIQPQFAAAHNNLGNVLHRLGRFGEAETAYRQSLRFRPADQKTQKNLGRALHDQGRLAEAAEQYHRVIAAAPSDAEALTNLGTVLASERQYDQAISHYEKALSIQPDDALAMTNLGNALKETGRVGEAIEWFRKSWATAPDARTGDCLMIALHLDPASSPQQIAQEHQRWEDAFAKPVALTRRFYSNDRKAGRRLRIGYVSPQFGDQIVGHCILALLANHDHHCFEIFCYSDTRRPDWMTEKLRQWADVWRNVVGLSDEAITAMIARDQIDVLVDLTMHMERNRLLAFARKPSPVQVTWIGYPSTTGLHAIDYRLSDRFLDPPAPDGGAGPDELYYTERTLRLPNSYWCYTPLEGLPPAGDLPVVINGYTTFGCLNSFNKVSGATLELWAAVLRAVEASRLLILAPQGSARQRVLQQLAAHGVDPARVGFLDRQPRRQYMDLYHQIDIGLDTIPYNGHTTTLDSLWMGVPVVSMTGSTAVSRGGLSILSNLGLAELCASTPDRFVQIAGDLASDRPRLAELRSTLRQRMSRSPLTDGPRFARDVESCYRSMWSSWCESTTPAISRGGSPALQPTDKTRFHILIVQPPNNPYPAAFYDVARLLELSLRSLGYEVSGGRNTPDPAATNIVLGYQILDRPPDGSWIPFQLEQLYTHPRTAKWLEILAQASHIWDYDPSNIEFLRSRGITNVTHVPLGFHPGLRTIVPKPAEIDVLHYGTVTVRRRTILDDLAKRCRVRSLWTVYGGDRDELIARSKIVLNIHNYEDSVFEQVRVSYLLNNGKCVVTEDSQYNPYREMAVSCRYEELVERCLSLLANDAQRERIAAEGARKFEAMPMSQILAAALQFMPPTTALTC